VRPSVKLLDSSPRWPGLSAAASPGPAAVQFADAQLRSSTVALGQPSSLLSTAPAGLVASALNCGPLSDCLIAPRVGQVHLLRGLPRHRRPSFSLQCVDMSLH